MADLVLDVVAPFAHETLHRVNGALGVGQQAALGFTPDMDSSSLRKRHHRRNQSIAVLVADHLGHAVLDVRD